MAANNGDLRERLAKLEALFRGAGATDGERAAAEAAIGRLRDRLEKDAPAREMQFTFPDVWAVRLFVAICRKHGLSPYRYPRQRRTTVMVRIARAQVDNVVWPEFSALHAELQLYFEETVDHLIRDAMKSDGDDSGLERAMLT